MRLNEGSRETTCDAVPEAQGVIPRTMGELDASIERLEILMAKLAERIAPILAHSEENLITIEKEKLEPKASAFPGSDTRRAILGFLDRIHTLNSECEQIIEKIEL